MTNKMTSKLLQQFKKLAEDYKSMCDDMNIEKDIYTPLTVNHNFGVGYEIAPINDYQINISIFLSNDLTVFEVDCFKMNIETNQFTFDINELSKLERSIKIARYAMTDIINNFIFQSKLCEVDYKNKNDVKVINADVIIEYADDLLLIKTAGSGEFYTSKKVINKYENYVKGRSN